MWKKEPARFRSEIPDLDAHGFGLLQVIMLAAFISMMALYFSSRTVSFQTTMSKIRIKDQIVNDRNIVKFELVNRPMPAPSP